MTSETRCNQPFFPQCSAFRGSGLRLEFLGLALVILILTTGAFAAAADKPSSPAPAQTVPAAGETALPLDGRDGRELALDQFRPRPMLKVSEHLLTHARIPVVDVHVHPRVRLRDSVKELDDFVQVMDQHNIALCVSLDGQLGESLDQHMKYLWTKHRDRFVILANVDWRGGGQVEDPASWDCQRPDFGRRMAEQLAAAKKAGASGLKVFKDLGLVYRNPDGSLIKVDDPRWDPIWEACGELGFPVLIHTADPAAFFLPIDQFNERWEELRRHPDWSFYKPGYPTFAECIEQLEHIVARHPKTTFVGAHMTNQAEDLTSLGHWLDKYPNLNVDLAARIAELGRQPVTARKFIIKYADRVLFGTDGPRASERLTYLWRFLETTDEYFPYAENAFPPQGFWRIYGIDLPDDVLEKVYWKNAARVFPGIKERYEAYLAGKR